MQETLVRKRLPEWLRRNVPSLEKTREVRSILKTYSLNTVCENAACPNQGECFTRKTATFLIMGRVCTRLCKFCNITKGEPLPLDTDEPLRIANAVKDLNLKHVVVTSVTRDDIKDKGAEHFARTIIETRAVNPNVTIEVLTPDFMGDVNNLQVVLNANPDIFNHNLETVPRLYQSVRIGADYERSLHILNMSKKIAPHIITKSGLILGFGETRKEIIEVLKDLNASQCDIITIGQYMQPSLKHIPVTRYLLPGEFDQIRDEAYEIGFKHVFSAPLVRSSYMADSVNVSKFTSE